MVETVLRCREIKLLIGDREPSSDGNLEEFQGSLMRELLFRGLADGRTQGSRHNAGQ
jgi:hypothetical protein